MKDFVWEACIPRLREELSAALPGYEGQKFMLPEGRKYIDPPPQGARQSGVLLLLFPLAGKLHLVLIERSRDGGVHSGQIALPGGKKEPFDKDLVATALREAREEINLDADKVTVLGRLSPLYIQVSNFLVHPVVAVADPLPALEPFPLEVTRIYTPALAQVFERKEVVRLPVTGSPGLSLRTPAYRLDGEGVIWGATAMILSELEYLLMR